MRPPSCPAPVPLRGAADDDGRRAHASSDDVGGAGDGCRDVRSAAVACGPGTDHYPARVAYHAEHGDLALGGRLAPGGGHLLDRNQQGWEICLSTALLGVGFGLAYSAMSA